MDQLVLTEAKNKLKERELDLLLKRGMDILLAGLLLLFLTPFMLLIALVIKLTSKGPVLFTQQRMGLHGDLFTCFKFRSMRVKGLMPAVNADGILYKQKDDKRVTLIGKVIRKTSLDELPQLYNVLTGDMSLVGPRPLIPFMLDRHPEFAAIRSLVRPGITGVWQINNRSNNTSAEHMMEYDLKYLNDFSFKQDLKILFYTIPAVFKTEGAI